MTMIRLSIITILTILTFSSCRKKEEVESKLDNLTGSWKVKSVQVEEYRDGKLFYIHERKPDSVKIEFYSDHVYTLKDNENIMTFITEGNVDGSRFFEGGTWDAENNFSQIRLDKNVPESQNPTNKNPCYLNIQILNSHQLEFEYNLNPLFNRKDTILQDSTCFKFTFFDGYQHGKTGGINNSGYTYEEGYDFGYEVARELGYYAATRILTSKYGYQYGAYVSYRIFLEGRNADFDLGFRRGGQASYNLGVAEGQNDQLSQKQLSYKYHFKLEKQADL